MNATTNGKAGRLSKVQLKRLKEAADAPVFCEAWGYGRQASRDASAWHRTYESLWGRGLVERPIRVKREVYQVRRGYMVPSLRVVRFVPQTMHGYWQITDEGRKALAAEASK